LTDIERKDKPSAGVPAADKHKKKTQSKPEKMEAAEPKESGNKLQYEERKVLEKKIRKLSNRVKALEREVEDIEAELAKMDEMLMNPDNIQGMQVYEDYEKLKTRHDEALSNWEKQTIQLEKTEARRK
jgi:ATP-binding cassette subfamily F protein 3